MNRPDDFYALLLFLSFISCCTMALFTWQRRKKAGAIAILIFTLAIAEWSLTYAIHWLLREPQQRAFWLNLTYLGAVTVPAAFFLFTLVYTQHEKWITPRRLILLAIEPTAVLLLLWSDEQHNLFFGGRRAPDTTMFLEGGPIFWLNIIYSYLLILIGFVLLLQMYAQVRAPYRRQVGFVLLGASLPWLGNVISLAGVRPPGLDITPLFFLLTGLIFTAGLFRAGLLDLVPVARSRLIETMADGVLVLDTADRLVDINPAAAALFQKSQAELIGQPLEALFERWPDELEHLRHLPDGSEEICVGARCFELQIIPLYNRRQQANGRLITWRDVTRRKQAELERERLIQELDAYAQTVAHDLKSPLATTIGYAEMLMEMAADAPRETQAAFLARVRNNSRHMLRIVDELLLLATIRNREHIPIEPLAMFMWVHAALERLEITIQEAQAEIVQPDQWPLCLGYGPWIEEVWVNYISNSLKYGGRPPQVTLGSDLLPDGMVRFWVKDNGPGLDEAAQRQLFQEFVRLERHKRVEGHGLGLSIVRRILERLGGQAGVESAPGQGCLFFFTLPQAETDQTPGAN